ncbi:MAG: SprT family zinc-dependent metalloprotease [Acetobacteraceae bacterium]|nr:SprT family zinc-dependent metalloprotease [Acetobacteraceae bacterium]
MDNDSFELVTLPGGPAPVRWRRSKRARRVSLRIDPKGGSVIVTLPQRTARATGMALLVNHAQWVADRLLALPQRVTFEDGVTVSLCGVPHPIRHVAQGRAGVQVEQGEICVSGDADFIPRRVSDFLRAEAKRVLVPQAIAKAALIGARPTRVSLKDTSSRWGSCTASGNLAFSWRLVMAPSCVQDYVVAHEVAHLAHMNHSDRFWSLVDDLTPHTKPAMAWLRSEGLQLLRVG